MNIIKAHDGEGGGYDKHGICLLCDKPRTPDGHDPCIANLPGVKFACCGHGVRKGYVSFDNGIIIDFASEDIVTRR